MDRGSTGAASVGVLDGRASSGGRATDMLERVAVALSSTLELHDVLRVLAEIGIEAIGAERASVLLVDGDRLEPAAAIAREPDDGLWVEFRGMTGVPIDDLRRTLLAAGRVVVINDARADPVVPPVWVERFSLHALAIVPLVADGESCGVIALDWTEARTFGPAEIRLLETIGQYAGVAVHNARLFAAVRRRAQLQEALARAGASLGSPLAPPEIAERLVDAYTDLLGTRVAAVAQLDARRHFVTRVATRGARHIAAPLAVDEMPSTLVARVTRAWARQHGALEIGDDPWLRRLLGGDDVSDVAWYLLLPLVVDGHTSGVAVLGFSPKTRLDREEIAAAEALASIAAAALERHALVERLDTQLRRLDALHGVTAALTEEDLSADLVARLNELLHDHGVEIVSVTFRDRRFARHLGGDEATAAERAAWRANNGPVALDGDVLAVPMRLGRRLVGMLRVRPQGLSTDQRAFLEAVAGAVAEVANRGVARAEAEEAARLRAVALERDRIRGDLHDTAGQMFVALGLLAARHAETFTPGSVERTQALRLAELAADGKWAIDQAIRALAFVPAGRSSLVAALRSFARTVETDSGITVRCTTRGPVRSIGDDVGRALFRVATEAVSNSWRHARPSVIEIVLEARADSVVLTVRDDGVGLAGSTTAGSGHCGIPGMRRVINDVRGSLRVSDRRDGGVVITARVPSGAP